METKKFLGCLTIVGLAAILPVHATTTTISINGFYAANQLSDGTAMTTGTARFGFFIDTGALVTSDSAITSRWTSLLGSSATFGDAVSSFTSTFYSVLGTKASAIGTSSIGTNGRFQILFDPDSETQENVDFQAVLDMNPATAVNNLQNSSGTGLKLNLLGTTPYVLVTSGNEIGVFKAGAPLPAVGGSFDSYSLAVRGTSVTALTGLGSTFTNGIQTIPEPSAGALLIGGLLSLAAFRRRFHTRFNVNS